MPIRLYLNSFALTPTMRNVEDRFTVKYYLNLVIVDSQDNKYFKQQVNCYRCSAVSVLGVLLVSYKLSFTTSNSRITALTSCFS